MRTSKVLAAGVALASLVTGLPAQAAVNGWFDALYVGMVGSAYGWLCDDSNPYVAPPGTLLICSGAPAGQGGSCYEYPLSANGMSRPDAASACGGNAAVGWGYYTYFSNPVYASYRHPDGSLQLLGGSGKVCTQYGWCY